MTKKDIIETLNNYNLDKDKFIIITGAALVLQNFSNQTRDIDIWVSKDYYEYLLSNFNCEFDRINEFGNKAFMIDDVINFSFDFCPNNYAYINGYKVASLRDCYNVKKLLNRDKDKKLLLKLEKELNKCL